MLYDVTGKPAIRPRQVPVPDEAGLKTVLDAQGKRCRWHERGGEDMPEELSADGLARLASGGLAVEMRAPGDLKPYEGNPRINDQAVEAVANSIREFGFRQSIVADADGVIICGHTRWKAALKLGLVKVPVHVVNEPTPEGSA